MTSIIVAAPIQHTTADSANALLRASSYLPAESRDVSDAIDDPGRGDKAEDAA